MRRFHLLLGVIVVVAAAAAAVVLLWFPNDQDNAPRSGQLITDEAKVNKSALAFVQPAYRDDYGNMRIAGYVDNLGDRHLVAANLVIELRDEEGNRSAVIEHSVKSIPPRQRRWFDIDSGTWQGPQSTTIAVESIEVAR